MAPRRTLGSLTVDAAALLIVAGVAALALSDARADHRTQVLAAAVAALVTMVVGLGVGRLGAVAVGTGALGVSCALSQLGRSPAIGIAALFAIGVFAAFELASFSITSRSVVRFEQVVRTNRRRALAITLGGGAVAASVVAVAGRAGRSAGIAPFTIGAIAAVAVLVLLGRLIDGGPVGES